MADISECAEFRRDTKKNPDPDFPEKGAGNLQPAHM